MRILRTANSFTSMNIDFPEWRTSAHYISHHSIVKETTFCAYARQLIGQRQVLVLRRADRGRPQFHHRKPRDSVLELNTANWIWGLRPSNPSRRYRTQLSTNHH